MIRVSRLLAVALGVIGAAVVVVASTRTWAYVTVPDLGGLDHLPLSGRKAAPIALPVALAGGAGVIVMATSGRLIRRMVAAGLVAGGGLVILAVLEARRDTASSAAAAMESTAGMVNQTAVLKLPAELLARATADLTIWPMISITGGALMATCGLMGLVTGARWPGPAQRFEVSEGRPASANGLTSGADATPGTSAGATPPAADDARTWDALSRGDDPT